jgi:hypothetical protein
MSISILASITNISRVMFDALLTSALSYVPFQVILLMGIAEEVWFLWSYG